MRYRCVAGLLGACVALMNASASGQVVSGDTLLLNGTVYRLWGIDAPERNQYCSDGWPAGSLAKARLQSLIDGKAVHCEERERDIYGQSVAVCTASGTDLAAKLVREGLAWLSKHHAQDYIDQEARAKEEGLGIHTHPCNPPWIWRSERRQQARQQIVAEPRQCERRR